MEHLYTSEHRNYEYKRVIFVGIADEKKSCGIYLNDKIYMKLTTFLPGFYDFTLDQIRLINKHSDTHNLSRNTTVYSFSRKQRERVQTGLSLILQTKRFAQARYSILPKKQFY